MLTRNKTFEVTVVEYKTLLPVIITVSSSATTTAYFSQTLGRALGQAKLTECISHNDSTCHQIIVVHAPSFEAFGDVHCLTPGRCVLQFFLNHVTSYSLLPWTPLSGM